LWNVPLDCRALISADTTMSGSTVPLPTSEHQEQLSISRMAIPQTLQFSARPSHDDLTQSNVAPYDSCHHKLKLSVLIRSYSIPPSAGMDPNRCRTRYNSKMHRTTDITMSGSAAPRRLKKGRTEAVYHPTPTAISIGTDEQRHAERSGPKVKKSNHVGAGAHSGFRDKLSCVRSLPVTWKNC